MASSVKKARSKEFGGKQAAPLAIVKDNQDFLKQASAAPPPIVATSLYDTSAPMQVFARIRPPPINALETKLQSTQGQKIFDDDGKLRWKWDDRSITSFDDKERGQQ
jgi:hypothetical protein